VSFFAAIIGVAILAHFGRKCVTLYGNLLLAVCDIVIGIFFIFQDWSASGYIILAFLIIYSFVFGSSIGPIVWLYVPEIIPSKIVPFATMTNWLGASICVIFTPIVIKLNNNNPYPVFFFFGAITFIFFIMNVFLMVETKGRTKAEVAKIFNKEA
jgi:MFS transporter, SP family, arabinose:H+ symporter